MTLTPQERRLLDALVREVPAKLDRLYEQFMKPGVEWGACTSYSRLLAEVLVEFGIWAEVRPVYVVTANRIGVDAIEGKITKEEAVKQGGKVQIWGDIKYGQIYQHAVCYISGWDVVVDLTSGRRGSGLVPSHPYWAEDKKFPWWIVQFEFRTYPLEYQVYEVEPDKVRRAKDIIRDVVRRYKE